MPFVRSRRERKSWPSTYSRKPIWKWFIQGRKDVCTNRVDISNTLHIVDPSWQSVTRPVPDSPLLDYVWTELYMDGERPILPLDFYEYQRGNLASGFSKIFNVDMQKIVRDLFGLVFCLPSPELSLFLFFIIHQQTPLFLLPLGVSMHILCVGKIPHRAK